MKYLTVPKNDVNYEIRLRATDKNIPSGPDDTCTVLYYVHVYGSESKLTTSRVYVNINSGYHISVSCSVLLIGMVGSPVLSLWRTVPYNFSIKE